MYLYLKSLFLSDYFSFRSGILWTMKDYCGNEHYLNLYISAYNI